MTTTRVAVIGGGVSGLAVGFELLEQGLPPSDLVVFESSDHPGGNVQTDRFDDYRIERGPNGFLDNSPPTLDLVRRTGLEDRLLPSREAAAIRFIFRGGKLHELPTSPPGMLRSGLLSWQGKLRLFCEPFISKGGSPEESVFEFAARRIGTEAARILVDPMVSGVFAGNAKKLELRAAFPRMVEMEERYGGLVRALLAIRREKKKSGERSSGTAGPGGRLTSFRDGMGELVDALAGRLGSSLRTGAPIASLREDGGRYVLSLPSGEEIGADRVVLACPAAVAAEMVAPCDDRLATELAAIRSAPITVVATVYDRDDLGRDPIGFGFLVPRGEGPRILGCLWTSAIWEDRAPDDRVLLRSMAGGAHDPDAADLPEDDLLALVSQDLERTMGVRAGPIIHRIYRYRRGIAQYEPGHTARLERITEGLRGHPGLFVSGSSYGGISVNSCLAEAPGIAARILG